MKFYYLNFLWNMNLLFSVSTVQAVAGLCYSFTAGLSYLLLLSWHIHLQCHSFLGLSLYSHLIFIHLARLLSVTSSNHWKIEYGPRKLWFTSLDTSSCYGLLIIIPFSWRTESSTFRIQKCSFSALFSQMWIQTKYLAHLCNKQMNE